MRKFSLQLTALVIALAFIVACHSSKHTAHNSYSKKPKFIDDIYVGRHNRNSVKMDVVQHKKGATKKSKTENIDEDSKQQTAEIDPADKGTLREKYANKLGIKSKEIKNYTLYEFIDKWYGVTYKSGGTDKSGIDCSGFAQRLYNDVYGVNLFRTAADQMSNCEVIKHINNLDEGDLVFFHIHSKHITHVGIYLANNYFVHASSSQGVVISNLNEDYWSKYYAYAGRVPKDN